MIRQRSALLVHSWRFLDGGVGTRSVDGCGLFLAGVGEKAGRVLEEPAEAGSRDEGDVPAASKVVPK